MSLSRRNLPLNALRYFEVAARHRHLRRAAAELGVTHGAVSRQIRALELALGTDVFDRAHNRIQLTAGGQRLFDVVADALDRVTEAALCLDPGSMAGSFTVATTPSISVYWMISVAGEFCLKYPEVELHLINIDPLQKSLPAEVDIAVCYGIPDAKRRHIRELYRESFFPVASPRLIAGAPTILGPDDLLRFPLIHDRHNMWPRWFDAQGISEARASRNIFVQEAFQAILAARQGSGIFIADQVEVAHELRDGTLIRLLEGVGHGPHPIVLVSDPDDKLPVRVRVFIDYLLKSLTSRAGSE